MNKNLIPNKNHQNIIPNKPNIILNLTNNSVNPNQTNNFNNTTYSSELQNKMQLINEDWIKDESIMDAPIDQSYKDI